MRNLPLELYNEHMGKLYLIAGIRYEKKDKLELELFGKKLQMDVEISIDEDEMPIEEAIIELGKQYQMILDNREELEKEINAALLEYINEEWVNGISTGVLNEDGEVVDGTYGLYDKATDTYLPYTDIAQFGHYVKNANIYFPVGADENYPLFIAVNVYDDDIGFGIGIIDGKLTEVGDQQEFM